MDALACAGTAHRKRLADVEATPHVSMALTTRPAVLNLCTNCDALNPASGRLPCITAWSVHAPRLVACVEAKYPFEKKRPKVFWRGTATGYRRCDTCGAQASAVPGWPDGPRARGQLSLLRAMKY